MGKAKKGKNKAKKQQLPTLRARSTAEALEVLRELPLARALEVLRELLDDSRALEVLRELLDNAKKNNRSEASLHPYFCDMIQDIAESHPEAFQYGNYQSEIPITVVVAQEKHGPRDVLLRENAYMALLSLITTPCLDAVFKYGAKALKSCMEEYLGYEEILENVIDVIFINLENYHQPAQPYDDLGKVEFHDAVIKAMKTYPANEDISFGGGNILAGILQFCSDGDRRDTILTDTIGQLLGAVDSSQKADLMFPLLPLCFIMTQNPSAVPTLKDANGPRRVIAMMERFPGDPNLQGIACDFLSYFTEYKELQNSCFHAVMPVLRSYCEDARTRQSGMRFMERMYSSPGGRSLLLESGHIPFFLKLMKQHKEYEVQLVGCAILDSFTEWDDSNQPITAKEAAYLLGEALKINPPEGKIFLWTAGVCSIQNLVMGGYKETVVDAFLNEDCFSYLAEGLEWIKNHEDSNEVTEWCFLREMASSKRNDVKLEIATSGCAAVIIDLMKRNPSKEEIQECGCEALGLVTINKDPEIFGAISKVDGVNVILDAIEKFPKNKVIFNFGGSAALLTREYEDNKKYGKLDLSRSG